MTVGVQTWWDAPVADGLTSLEESRHGLESESTRTALQQEVDRVNGRLASRESRLPWAGEMVVKKHDAAGYQLALHPSRQSRA